MRIPPAQPEHSRLPRLGGSLWIGLLLWAVIFSGEVRGQDAPFDSGWTVATDQPEDDWDDLESLLGSPPTAEATAPPDAAMLRVLARLHRQAVSSRRRAAFAQPTMDGSPDLAKDEVILQGRAAFRNSCTECHTAERATDERRSLSEWRETIQRMIDEQGAEIPEEDREPIALYLASLNLSARQDRPQADEDENEERSPRFDPAVVSAGQAAFSRSCTQCHDANRATSKRKSLAAWRSTVRRMAAKEDANVAPGDIEPIATYLASLGDSVGAGDDDGGDSSESFAEQFSVYATVSTTWRGGNDDLENAGFFPEVWVGGEWHNESPLSGRVSMCVTCHSEGGPGNRFELVQGSLRLNVHQWLEWEEDAPQIAVEAGRILVPFGAFTATSQPGAYRTVTKPMIFNMGQNVHRGDLGPAVLPLPYADEGAVINVDHRFGCDYSLTFDFYTVNGLQGNLTGINFFTSRDYVDNNFEPAVGGRVTVGSPYVRLGSSLMSGRFNDLGGSGPSGVPLHYRVVGADATVRYEDIFRFQFEYALRVNDRMLLGADPQRTDEEVDGYYFETELRIWEEPRIGLIARYGQQRRNSELPPPNSTLADGQFTTERFTWGFNMALPGGSLLILNHERWFMDKSVALADVDVIGLRWVGTF